MPKGDTWHGGATLVSLNNMESAGSCDSVISVTSGYSEDSLEHLSAEEMACLMYLEQTIEALEVQEDSGISNDEPDSGHQAKKTGRSKEIASLNVESGMNRSCETLPPLLVDFPSEKWRTLTGENLDEHHLLSHTCDVDVEAEAHEASVNATTEDRLVTPDSVAITSYTEGSPFIDFSPDTLTCTTSKVNAAPIPPPSDFMDNTGLGKPLDVCVKAPPLSSSSKSVSVDLFYQRALEKRAPGRSPNNQKPAEKHITEASLSSPALESLLSDTEGPEVTKPNKFSMIVTPSPEIKSPTGNSDLERIHLEALQKLGLLQGYVTDRSPETQKPRADVPSQSSVSPSPLTPSLLSLSSSTPSYTSISPLSSASDVPPSPVAFGHFARHRLSQHEQSPVKHVLRKPVDADKLRSSPRTSSNLVKQLIQVPSGQPGPQLRTSHRPSRPVSYHEGISAERCLSNATSADFRRHTPFQTAFEQSKKVVRPQGFSVMVRPRDENGIEALKKLKLFKD
ncbi:specifically androgen-regulated gene protein-like isoform X2 [Nerophis ophidion]|nr:specifically androgen-regulated gene protein-like isoform X2 [Nerophis ophidion]XP_061759248.1 specifically androgen-regulated gene protein-like isoform X2 [Nerophis ophidion]XP_061759249.1 specifically androgen-regulated gene protein-like isoform X2 [Nerophis ophidion]